MTILVQKPYKMGEVEILQDWANIIVVLKGNSGLSERGRLRPRDFVTCGIWISEEGRSRAAANEYRIHNPFWSAPPGKEGGIGTDALQVLKLILPL